jgi:hypothetical protein
MYFAGTASRASAIPTPSTGMTTYIGTTGTATIPQLETYTGSQWQTPYGMTQVANVSFTTASAVQVDNVFTSSYDNYKIIFKTTAFSGTNVAVYTQFVDGTTPIGTNTYYQGLTGITDGSTAALSAGINLTALTIAYGSSSGGDITSLALDVITPQKSEKTTALISSYNWNGTNTFSYVGGGLFNASTQFEGIRFFTSTGTFSGTVRVYGYRNS